MPSPRSIARFAGVFAAVYGLLIFPWPGWNPLYGRAFRAMGSALLSRSGPDGIVAFRAAAKGRPLDTEIVLVDPRRAGPGGLARGKVLGIDSRGVGWVPTAFFCALASASWFSSRRRRRALGIGFLAVQAYVVATIAAYIWSQSLPDHASFTGQIAAGLEQTLVTQIGASFVVPAIIWALAVLRPGDLDRI